MRGKICEACQPTLPYAIGTAKHRNGKTDCVLSSYYRNDKYLCANRILICCCHFVCLLVCLFDWFCYIVRFTWLVLDYICAERYGRWLIVLCIASAIA